VLSHGLPALAASGSRVVRKDTGEPVLLRGVNLSGLEYARPIAAGFLEAAHISRTTIGDIAGWGANIIRLPFNQHSALYGFDAHPAEQYLRSIDQVVSWAAQAGCYTLLDLHWLKTGIAPLPDHETAIAWHRLGLRYAREPAVLFDLYNEPHDAAVEVWREWARFLTGVIRNVHTESLIFVSGVDWGYDLRGVPFDEAGIVYSTHAYPWKAAPWSEAFEWLASEAPLFAAEWGGEEEHLEWGRQAAARFDQLGIGWTAWSWSDRPHLIRGGTPTAFGDLVRSALAPASHKIDP